MRLIPALAPLLVAQALVAQVNYVDVYMQSYWRSATSGDHDVTEVMTADGTAQFIHNNVVATHYAIPGDALSMASVAAGYSGYWKQYTWVSFTVSADTQVRFYGMLAPSTVQAGDYQYAYVASMTGGWNYLYIAGGAPFAAVVEGPLAYDTLMTLHPGITYAYEVSTSWLSASDLASGMGAGGPIITAGMSFPVPEPSTYGLALGGLALAVVAARGIRRQFVGIVDGR